MCPADAHPAVTDGEPRSPGPVRAPTTLAETVDHLIARGVVLQGEVALAVAGTELVRLDLSAVLRAVVRPPPRDPVDPGGDGAAASGAGSARP